jgi:4-hydroxy-tetrahydrodipicolinate reductase
MSIKVAINGAGGRMGRRLMAFCVKNEKLELAQALEYDKHPLLGKCVRDIDPEADSDIALECGALRGDVLIDFSSPEGTVARAKEAAAKGVALVVGTTGLDEAQTAEVRAAAKKIPVIHASNYSLGVNLVFRVAAEIAQALGEDFNIEIAEAHHNKKADAPSGTALSIAEKICAATGRDLKKNLVHGRSGKPGARTKNEIGMHALRLGSVVGDHTVYYASDFERIELTHRAQTRDVFAAGALRAAAWLAGKKPGMYEMGDVLFG